MTDSHNNCSAATEDEADAWLVRWFRANGDNGVNAYVALDEARRAAENLEKYSSSETTAVILPLDLRAPQEAETHKLPGHDETMANLDALTIRRAK